MNIDGKFYLVNSVYNYFCYVDEGNLGEENISIDKGFQVDETGIWLLKDYLVPKELVTEIDGDTFLEAMNNVLTPLSLIINKMVSKLKSIIIGEMIREYYGNNKTN